MKGITVVNKAVAGSAANNNHKKTTFKNGAPFTHCMSKINNTQEDNPKNNQVVMLMYNSDDYSKTYGRLRQHYRDEPF